MTSPTSSSPTKARPASSPLDGKGRLPDAIKAHAPEVLLLMEGANDINFHGPARRHAAWSAALEDMIKDAHRRG